MIFERVVFETAQKFQNLSSDHESWQAAIEAVHSLGGNAVNLAGTTASGSKPAWGRSSMSEAWLKEYSAKNYHRIDPLLKVLISGPEITTIECGTLPSTDPAYELNHGLKTHGYGSLCATVSGGRVSGYRALTVFCSPNTLSEVRNEVGFDLLNVVHAIIAANTPTQLDQNGANSVSIRTHVLTSKERDILSWLACGLRNDQIAFKAGIAEVTVRKHLASVRTKIGAKTREQAIAFAIRDGWI